MKTTSAFLALATFFFSQIGFASDASLDDGKHLYNTYCSACHGVTGDMDMSKRVAPPMVGIRFHYITAHPEKAPFVKAISDWLVKQDATQSLMPGAIRKFGIMPPVAVSEEQAKKIATYVFEGKLEKPEGFDAHFEKMHGKK